MHGPWEIVQLAFCQTGPIDKPNYGKFNVLNAFCASKGSRLLRLERVSSAAEEQVGSCTTDRPNYCDFPVLARQRVPGNKSPMFLF
jgi:2-keto-3-deoxy-6-phosphogluconate aldolase